jgi:ABC-type nitrate/sulfonate/bicarbonate transport system substrate-binding protein
MELQSIQAAVSAGDNMARYIEFRRVAIAAALFLVTIVSPSGAGAQMKARFNWTSPASNLSGSWVAYEEGFFKKNGLEVELLHIPSTSRAIQTMLAGEIAFSYTDGRNAVTAALRGADVVMLAGVANHFVFSFMARPEIKRISDLRGKRIGITRIGSSSHTVTLWIMNRAGLKPDEYQLVPLVEVPNVFTAIVAGQIDAGALSPPTSFRGRKAALNELVDLTKEDLEYVSVAVGTTRSYVRANEEITRRFIRAYSEAIAFLKTNKTATMRIIQKYARIQDAEILELTYAEARAHIEYPPYMSRKGIEAILGELAPTEPKAKQAKPEDFIDHRFVSQLDKEGFFKNVSAK